MFDEKEGKFFIHTHTYTHTHSHARVHEIVALLSERTHSYRECSYQRVYIELEYEELVLAFVFSNTFHAVSKINH